MNDRLAIREGEEPLPIKLLLAFVGELIRNTVSADLLLLALDSAQGKAGASKEEMQTLKKLILHYHKTNKIWPEGF